MYFRNAPPRAIFAADVLVLFPPLLLRLNPAPRLARFQPAPGPRLARLANVRPAWRRWPYPA